MYPVLPPPLSPLPVVGNLQILNMPSMQPRFNPPLPQPPAEPQPPAQPAQPAASENSRDVSIRDATSAISLLGLASPPSIPPTIRDPTHALIWRYLTTAYYIYEAQSLSAGMPSNYYPYLLQHLVREIRSKLIPTFPNNRSTPVSFIDLLVQIRDVLFHGDFASLQFADTHLRFRAVRDASIQQFADFITWFWDQEINAREHPLTHAENILALGPSQLITEIASRRRNNQLKVDSISNLYEPIDAWMASYGQTHAQPLPPCHYAIGPMGIMLDYAQLACTATTPNPTRPAPSSSSLPQVNQSHDPTISLNALDSSSGDSARPPKRPSRQTDPHQTRTQTTASRCPMTCQLALSPHRHPTTPKRPEPPGNAAHTPLALAISTLEPMMRQIAAYSDSLTAPTSIRTVL